MMQDDNNNKNKPLMIETISKSTLFFLLPRRIERRLSLLPQLGSVHRGTETSESGKVFEQNFFLQLSFNSFPFLLITKDLPPSSAGLLDVHIVEQPRCQVFLLQVLQNEKSFANKLPPVQELVLLVPVPTSQLLEPQTRLFSRRQLGFHV